jgi:hypothetical protein
MLLDHTLIAPWASVGPFARTRSICHHLESARYDWLGPGRTTRNGFDSRYRYQLLMSPACHESAGEEHD